MTLPEAILELAGIANNVEWRNVAAGALIFLTGVACGMLAIYIGWWL